MREEESIVPETAKRRNKDRAREALQTRR